MEHAPITTAADAPNGTASSRAMSTVGMEISASTTATDAEASAEERATISPTSRMPMAAEQTTVSRAMARFVRDPAISQLSTSAPVPSVPSQCADDGLSHTW